jgi:hypothetical protein
VVEACQRQGARFSISMRLQASHRKLIESIPEERWTSIPYWKEGAASVAEIDYAPFGLKRSYRMIIRRVEALADGQRLLPGVGNLHFAFITDREGDMLELEADHRPHAVVENVIRDLKYGLALNHMSSGKFGANAAWLALNVIAHNLVRWMNRLAGFAVACLKAWRPASSRSGPGWSAGVVASTCGYLGTGPGETSSWPCWSGCGRWRRR